MTECRNLSQNYSFYPTEESLTLRDIIFGLHNNSMGYASELLYNYTLQGGPFVYDISVFDTPEFTSCLATQPEPVRQAIEAFVTETKAANANSDRYVTRAELLEGTASEESIAWQRAYLHYTTNYIPYLIGAIDPHLDPLTPTEEKAIKLRQALEYYQREWKDYWDDNEVANDQRTIVGLKIGTQDDIENIITRFNQGKLELQELSGVVALLGLDIRGNEVYFTGTTPLTPDRSESLYNNLNRAGVDPEDYPIAGMQLIRGNEEGRYGYAHAQAIQECADYDAAMQAGKTANASLGTDEQMDLSNPDVLAQLYQINCQLPLSEIDREYSGLITPSELSLRSSQGSPAEIDYLNQWIQDHPNGELPLDTDTLWDLTLFIGFLELYNRLGVEERLSKAYFSRKLKSNPNCREQNVNVDNAWAEYKQWQQAQLSARPRVGRYEAIREWKIGHLPIFKTPIKPTKIGEFGLMWYLWGKIPEVLGDNFGYFPEFAGNMLIFLGVEWLVRSPAALKYYGLSGIDAWLNTTPGVCGGDDGNTEEVQATEPVTAAVPAEAAEGETDTATATQRISIPYSPGPVFVPAGFGLLNSLGLSATPSPVLANAVTTPFNYMFPNPEALAAPRLVPVTLTARQAPNGMLMYRSMATPMEGPTPMTRFAYGLADLKTGLNGQVGQASQMAAATRLPNWAGPVGVVASLGSMIGIEIYAQHQGLSPEQTGQIYWDATKGTFVVVGGGSFAWGGLGALEATGQSGLSALGAGTFLRGGLMTWGSMALPMLKSGLFGLAGSATTHVAVNNVPILRDNMTENEKRQATVAAGWLASATPFIKSLVSWMSASGTTAAAAETSVAGGALVAEGTGGTAAIGSTSVAGPVALIIGGVVALGKMGEIQDEQKTDIRILYTNRKTSDALELLSTRLAKKGYPNELTNEKVRQLMSETLEIEGADVDYTYPNEGLIFNGRREYTQGYRVMLEYGDTMQAYYARVKDVKEGEMTQADFDLWIRQGLPIGSYSTPGLAYSLHDRTKSLGSNGQAALCVLIEETTGGRVKLTTTWDGKPMEGIEEFRQALYGISDQNQVASNR